MQTDLHDLVRDLDDASEPESQAAFVEVAALARRDPDRFADALLEAPTGRLSPLAWVYEAIARDPDGWEDRIGAEVGRLLDAMPGASSARDLFLLLEGFAPLGSEPGRRAVVREALERAGSTSAAVRRAVVHLLADFSEPGDRDPEVAFARYRRDPTGRSEWRPCKS